MIFRAGAPPLLAAGYGNVDLVARLPRAVESGRVTVDRIEAAPGGMAANTACVAASLGSPVTLFAAVGTDSFGVFLLDAWKAHGVDVSRVLRTADRPTTKCLITVHPDGERTIISESMTFDYGPLLTLLGRRRFPPGAAVFFDGYRLVDFAKAADAARAAGLVAAADLDGCEEAGVLSAALPRLDIVFANASTLARLLGAGPVPRALAQIAAQGPRIVIGTSGREGAWVLAGSADASVVHVPGHAVEAVDTTGAGDAFNGAFLHAYGVSRDAAWSARYANAAAALSTSAPGALGHVPSDVEIRRLLDGAPPRA